MLTSMWYSSLKWLPIPLGSILQRHSQLWLQNRKNHLHQELQASAQKNTRWCRDMSTILIDWNTSHIVQFTNLPMSFPHRMTPSINSLHSLDKDSRYARREESLEAWTGRSWLAVCFNLNTLLVRSKTLLLTCSVCFSLHSSEEGEGFAVGLGEPKTFHISEQKSSIWSSLVQRVLFQEENLVIHRYIFTIQSKSCSGSNCSDENGTRYISQCVLNYAESNLMFFFWIFNCFNFFWN